MRHNYPRLFWVPRGTQDGRGDVYTPGGYCLMVNVTLDAAGVEWLNTTITVAREAP